MARQGGMKTSPNAVAEAPAHSEVGVHLTHVLLEFVQTSDEGASVDGVFGSFLSHCKRWPTHGESQTQ